MQVDSTTRTYFDMLDKDITRAYSLAEKARALGKDPENKVDIPVAKDLAERVQGLVSIICPQLAKSGLAEGIRELEKQYEKNDER
ncbi:unnamed protein product, partial [marine sediment metagenome]